MMGSYEEEIECRYVGLGEIHMWHFFEFETEGNMTDLKGILGSKYVVLP
jgi:hypothetical protein